jgi:hypothetical protein
MAYVKNKTIYLNQIGQEDTEREVTADSNLSLYKKRFTIRRSRSCKGNST